MFNGEIRPVSGLIGFLPIFRISFPFPFFSSPILIDSFAIPFATTHVSWRTYEIFRVILQNVAVDETQRQRYGLCESEVALVAGGAGQPDERQQAQARPSAANPLRHHRRAACSLRKAKSVTMKRVLEYRGRMREIMQRCGRSKSSSSSQSFLAIEKKRRRGKKRRKEREETSSLHLRPFS